MTDSERGDGRLAGLRVLVVEDQMLVAMEFERLLESFGCTVVGPVGRLAPALRLAREEAFDAAVLDVNLDGETVTPIADALRGRGIPFALATGYGENGLPAPLRREKVLEKPVLRAELKAFLTALPGRS